MSNDRPRRGEIVSITGGKNGPTGDFRFKSPQSLTVEIVGASQTLAVNPPAVVLEDGSYIKSDVTIPLTLAPGDYDIVVTGLDPSGNRIESIGPITVVADSPGGGGPTGPGTLPRTGWSASLLTVAGALGLGGIILLRTADGGTGPGSPAPAPAGTVARLARLTKLGSKVRSPRHSWPVERRKGQRKQSVRSWFKSYGRPW